jgi:hypothetical protein
MYSDNSNTNVKLGVHSPQNLYRGLYIRIARRLGVDPSYVSRVARGDRRSSEIESALHHALEEIDQQLGRTASSARSKSAPRVSTSGRLKVLMEQNRSRIRKQWLAHSQADPNLRRVKISTQKRTAPILMVLDEAMKVMKLDLRDMTTTPMKAAERHGRLRQAQGFPATALIEEYNLVRRCVFALAQEHARQMDPHLLIQDLTQFGEALDLQAQRALGDYLASA